MAFEFEFPDIGEGLTEAIVVKWLIDLGEPVGLDEPLVEVETDKAVTEIPAPRAGVLLYQGAAEGGTILVDQLLAVIGEPGESWQPGGGTEPAGEEAPAAPIVGTLSEDADILTGSGPPALPRIRKLAGDLGVDLAAVTGSGPGGRVTEDDVRAAVSTGGGPLERRRLSPTRRAIAEHLTKSWREIPHVVTYGSADASAALAARAAAEGDTPPLEALLIAALVPLLRDYPEFNATLQGDDLVLKHFYDIGIAVDTPDGLMVAVVRDAADRTLDDLGNEIRRLAAGARERTLGAADLRGATFTLSNIGAVGGRYGTPIIPYGTTAILSVGRADPEPVVIDDEVVVGRRFPLSLAYDHRVIDGALGRRFMGAVVHAVESIGV